MTDLKDYQFEIGGVVFGIGAPVSIEAENGFDPGSDEPEIQDVFNSFTSSWSFGADSVQPATWLWGLHTDKAYDSHTAMADAKALALAWNSAVDMRDPGAVAELRYCIAGRTRVVYGRPRRFAQAFDNGIIYGLLNLTAEFQRSDRLFYGDEVSSVSLGLQPQQSIGFVTPIITPLTTLAETHSVGVIPAVGGDVDAPFSVRIDGPSSGSVTNPKVSTDDWELELKTTIAAGESVTIDTHPWAMNAVRSDGANVSGYLSAKSRLSKARLAVGGQTVRLDGIDSSGTASATLSWRTAYSTI